VKPQRRRRLTYRQPTEEAVQQAWQRLLAVQGDGSVALDFLERISTSQSYSNDPYTTAFNEGQRALANEILTFTLGEAPKIEIETNLTED
jgi:hypothetical protein